MLLDELALIAVEPARGVPREQLLGVVVGLLGFDWVGHGPNS
jgi:hypothetical protein